MADIIGFPFIVTAEDEKKILKLVRTKLKTAEVKERLEICRWERKSEKFVALSLDVLMMLSYQQNKYEFMIKTDHFDDGTATIILYARKLRK